MTMTDHGKTRLRTGFRVFAALGIIMVLDLAVVPAWWVMRDRDALAAGPAPRTSYMRDAAHHGVPAREWQWTSLDSISPWLACAVVLAEGGPPGQRLPPDCHRP